MVKGREQRGSPTEPTNPTQFAQTPPPMSSGDYSFLEIVMSMQSTMGELKEAVNGLKESRTQQTQKLDNISDDIHTIKTKIYAAVAIFLIAGSVTGAILGIFGKPIVELIFNRGTSAPQTSSDPTKPR